MLLERLAGEIAGPELVLERVALEADTDRPILVHRCQRGHADVAARRRPSRHDLDVLACWTVARLAVDGERRESRLPLPRGGVEGELDLAAVAALTIGEARLVAEHAR